MKGDVKLEVLDGLAGAGAGGEASVAASRSFEVLGTDGFVAVEGGLAAKLKSPKSVDSKGARFA